MAIFSIYCACYPDTYNDNYDLNKENEVIYVRQYFLFKNSCLHDIHQSIDSGLQRFNYFDSYFDRDGTLLHSATYHNMQYYCPALINDKFDYKRENRFQNKDVGFNPITPYIAKGSTNAYSQLDITERQTIFSECIKEDCFEYLSLISKFVDNNNKKLIEDGLLDAEHKILFNKQNQDNSSSSSIGVETENLGSFKIQTYYARREIIIGGGSYDTSKLLMLSDIGDCDILQNNFSIDCIKHSPCIKQNLQDRVAITIQWQFIPLYQNINSTKYMKMMMIMNIYK